MSAGQEILVIPLLVHYFFFLLNKNVKTLQERLK